MFKRRRPPQKLEHSLDLLYLIHKNLLDYIEKPPLSSQGNKEETLFHISHLIEQIRFTVSAAQLLEFRTKEKKENDSK